VCLWARQTNWLLISDRLAGLLAGKNGAGLAQTAAACAAFTQGRHASRRLRPNAAAPAARGQAAKVERPARLAKRAGLLLAAFGPRKTPRVATKRQGIDLLRAFSPFQPARVCRQQRGRQLTLAAPNNNNNIRCRVARQPASRLGAQRSRPADWLAVRAKRPTADMGHSSPVSSRLVSSRLGPFGSFER